MPLESIQYFFNSICFPEGRVPIRRALPGKLLVPERGGTFRAACFTGQWPSFHICGVPLVATNHTGLLSTGNEAEGPRTKFLILFDAN